jgi:hypothetical protein
MLILESTASLCRSASKSLKFEYHEERRRKETADREREAAVQYAHQVKGENDTAPQEPE